MKKTIWILSVVFASAAFAGGLDDHRIARGNAPAQLVAPTIDSLPAIDDIAPTAKDNEKPRLQDSVVPKPGNLNTGVCASLKAQMKTLGETTSHEYRVLQNAFAEKCERQNQANGVDEKKPERTVEAVQADREAWERGEERKESGAID